MVNTNLLPCPPGMPRKARLNPKSFRKWKGQEPPGTTQVTKRSTISTSLLGLPQLTLELSSVLSFPPAS